MPGLHRLAVIMPPVPVTEYHSPLPTLVPAVPQEGSPESVVALSVHPVATAGTGSSAIAPVQRLLTGAPGGQQSNHTFSRSDGGAVVERRAVTKVAESI